MRRGEGKYLSKLPCRMRHIPLHLLALGFCLGTCPVPGGGRAGEPSPLHPTGWVCERGRECVCVCLCIRTWAVSSQPCPDIASSRCRSQLRAAQPLLTGRVDRKDSFPFPSQPHSPGLIPWKLFCPGHRNSPVHAVSLGCFSFFLLSLFSFFLVFPFFVWSLQVSSLAAFKLRSLFPRLRGGRWDKRL